MHEPRNGCGRVQDLLPLEDIDRDVVWLAVGGCRGVLAAGSLNFALAAEAEQEATLAAYRAFLGGLRFPLQVLVRVQPTDVERYLAGLRPAVGASVGPALMKLALDHETFVRRLARERVLLDRRFYVVVPAGDDPPTVVPAVPLPPRLWPGRRPAAAQNQQRALAVRTLADRCDQVAQGLGGLGLAVRRLTGRELAELWYAMLCPDRARLQPLPAITGPVVLRQQTHAEEVHDAG